MLERKNLIFLGVLLAAAIIVAVIALVGRAPAPGKIRIASLLPLDGQVAAYGEMVRNGQKLAEEEINARSDGPKVEVVFYNTSHKKDVTLQKMKEVNRDGIKYIAEIFGSDQALHTASYLNENKILVISGLDTAPKLTTEGGPFFWRIMPHDGVAAEQLARWASEMGIKRAGVIYVNDDWGTGLKEAMDKAHGAIELVSTRDSIRSQQNFQAVVTEIKRLKPEAVFLFVYPDDGGNFLKEAKKQGLQAKFFATENFTGTKMVETAGDAAEGVMLVVPGEKKEAGSLQEFKKKYSARFGSEPTIFAIQGYDAVRVTFEVAKQAGKDMDKALKILSGLTFAGLNGPISFDQNGDAKTSEYRRLVFRKTAPGKYETQPFIP